MRAVSLRVSDAAGRPRPCYLRITDPAGKHYPPHGAPRDFATGRGENVGTGVYLTPEKWAVAPANCEVELPAGVPLRFQLRGGPLIVPIDREVTLGPGQLALRFTLETAIDPRPEGWFCGDARAHFLTPDAALLEGQAAGLDLVNLLALEADSPSRDGHLYRVTPNLDAYSGQAFARQSPTCAVAVGTLNGHPSLGSVGLLNTHRVVHPLSAEDDDGRVTWSLADWCDQARRKGGLAVWASPLDPVPGEGLVACVNGKLDAFEVSAAARKSPVWPAYYRLLNAGFRLPLVGGSGKDGNRLLLGAPRTWARLAEGEPFTLAAWVEAVRAGHTAAGNGPLVTLAVDGVEPGGTVPAAGPVEVVARAWSLARFDALELVAGGEVVFRVEPSRQESALGQPWVAEARHTLSSRDSAWVAARCSGPPAWADPGHRQFAHTSPVYLGEVGQVNERVRQARRELIVALEQVRDWLADVAPFAEEKLRARLLAECDGAVGRLTAGLV